MHVYVQDACQETHIFSAFSGLLDIANNPFDQLQLYDMHKNADLFGTKKLSSTSTQALWMVEKGPAKDV